MKLKRSCKKSAFNCWVKLNNLSKQISCSIQGFKNLMRQVLLQTFHKGHLTSLLNFKIQPLSTATLSSLLFLMYTSSGKKKHSPWTVDFPLGTIFHINSSKNSSFCFCCKVYQLIANSDTRQQNLSNSVFSPQSQNESYYNNARLFMMPLGKKKKEKDSKNLKEVVPVLVPHTSAYLNKLCRRQNLFSLFHWHLYILADANSS